jgi:hypothetical protein
MQPTSTSSLDISVLSALHFIRQKALSASLKASLNRVLICRLFCVVMHTRFGLGLLCHRSYGLLHNIWNGHVSLLSLRPSVCGLPRLSVSIFQRTTGRIIDYIW